MNTFVYTYYDNPMMLAEHYRTWRDYPRWLRDRVRVVIVDDASPRWPALDVPRPEGLPEISIYRVRVDIPWHQDGARNLGAHVARDGWLFVSDMDHLMPAESLAVLERHQRDGCFYTFARLDAPNLTPTLGKDGQPKPGHNIYSLTRDLYWKMGGYDEDLCGAYGTDGPVRKRLLRIAHHWHLEDAPIVRYPREVIADASTTTLERRGPTNDARREAVKLAKREAGRGRDDIVTLAFEWYRVL